MEKNNIKNPIIENQKEVRDYENSDDDLNDHTNKFLKSNLLTCLLVDCQLMKLKIINKKKYYLLYNIMYKFVTLISSSIFFGLH